MAASWEWSQAGGRSNGAVWERGRRKSRAWVPTRRASHLTRCLLMCPLTPGKSLLCASVSPSLKRGTGLGDQSPNLSEVGSVSYPRALCRSCQPPQRRRKPQPRLHTARRWTQDATAIRLLTLCNCGQASKPPWASVSSAVETIINPTSQGS